MCMKALNSQDQHHTSVLRFHPSLCSKACMLWTPELGLHSSRQPTCSLAAAARPLVARRSWHRSPKYLASMRARSNLTSADDPCLSFSNLESSTL